MGSCIGKSKRIKIATLLFGFIFINWVTFRLLVPKNGVLALDVSHHNSKVSEHVKIFRPSLLIAKATEGVAFRDPKFDYHFKLAKENETYFGAYHFLSFDKDVKKQFDNYLKTIKFDFSTRQGYKINVRPILDVENNPGKAKMGYTDLRRMVHEFGELCLKEFDCYPIIYCDECYRICYFLTGFDQYLFWTRNTVTNPLFTSVLHQYKEDKILNLDFNRLYDLTSILLP